MPGLFGDGASMPDYPDPTKTIATQYEYNKKAAQDTKKLNSDNTVGPNGSTVWTQGPDGQYTQTTRLDPMTEGNWRLGQGNQAAAGNIAGAQLSGGAQGYANQYAGGGPDPIRQNVQPGQLLTHGLNAGDAQKSLNTDFNKQIQSAQNQEYQQLTSRLDPRFQQGQQSLDAKLAAQGIGGGSTAGRVAQDQFSRDRNDAYGQAGLQAAAAGYGLQNQLFGQSKQAGEFANAGLAQDQTRNLDIRASNNQGIQGNFTNDLASAGFSNNARKQGYDELAQTYGLSGAGQPPLLPQGSGGATASVNPGDYAAQVAARYKAQSDAYAAGQSGDQDIMNQILGLGTKAITHYAGW